MTGPLAAGEPIPAIAETTYTPQLSADTTNPTLGTGSEVLGRYYINPLTGWVHGQLMIRFGTSGVDGGSGSYIITLPTAIDQMSSSTLLIGVADIIGYGLVRDNSDVSTGSRQVIAFLRSSSDGPGGVGTIRLALVDGTNDLVTSSKPFAWGASDSIAVQFAYPAA